MSNQANQGIIYDWNLVGGSPLEGRRVRIHDETLRDGIQSPSAHDPTIEEKIEMLHFMESLGVDSLDIGLPGAGPRAYRDVTRLAREIAENRMRIRPGCAARTLAHDILPIVEVSQKVGIPIEVFTFIGSSPIRQYVEAWSVENIARLSSDAIDLAVENGLPVTYVTEDTTRSNPEALRTLFRAVIEHGARSLCLCDTVGHATPEGVVSLISFVRELTKEITSEPIEIQWHGHNDRGLALYNAIKAIEAGAERIHATALGIGERVGNTPLDLLLVNLRLYGLIDNDLSQLGPFCELSARATHFTIPENYPVVGADAFRTGTGVHAAAIIKAKKKGDVELADRVYSGVPANLFGREQEIEIGPMSGASNVIYWLEKRGLPCSDEVVQAILQKAKESSRLLTEAEIRAVLDR